MPFTTIYYKKHKEMKNRLQFNRIPRLFETREQANEFLRNYVDPAMRPDFIPLVGEPIVARYLDEDQKKQLILAIGKSVASGNVEYHFIDTALLKEGIAEATETAENAEEIANQALDIASDAAQSVANYFVILRNMIEKGIDLDNGSYFDDDDPTKDPSTCGELKGFENTNYLDGANSMRDADMLLDAAIGDVNDSVNELSAGTVAALEEASDLTGNIIEAVGLDEDGKYVQVTGSTFIRDAESAKDADRLLDAALVELSANTMAADQALDGKVDELSANTIAADQALAEKIASLENTKGADAIKVTMSGSDKTISLALVNGEKVLTQDIYGLKTNIDLYYSKDEKKIYLLGADNNVISEVDASDFIKDGMLDHVNVFVATEEDHREYPQLVVGETYLALYFNTDAVSGGTVSPAFISVKDLVDVYTVSATSLAYLTIDGYEIRANVEDDRYPDSLASYNSVKALSGVTDNILAGTGLNTLEPGEYPSHEGTKYINSATNLDQADVLLDLALQALSGVVADMEGGSEAEEMVRRLSAVTREFSATTDTRINELCAWTETIDEVTAGALNDLNNRVATIETHFTGEYMPLTNYEMASGLTEDELLIDEGDSVNEAFGKVQKQILDNEEVTAAGLNDLNNRLLRAEEEIAHNTGVTALSGAVMDLSAGTVSELGELNDKVDDLTDNIDELNGNIDSLSSFTQFLSAHSLGMLTVNLNGVEQGKYCPSASTTLNLEAIQEVTGADVLLTGYELATGTSEEELVVVPTDNVNEAFGKIQKQIYDDEAVVAGALNDLSGHIATLEETVITGVSVDGIAQPITNHVANIQLSIPVVNSFFDGADYDSTNKRINFYNGQTVVDYVDATAFIKDGMLNNVEVVTVSGEAYLRFTFNTDAGKEAIDVKVSDFAALYEAGSGVSITNDNVINLKLAGKGDSDYIKLDGDGLYLTGVSAMANGVQALSAATTALSQNLNTLSGAAHNKITALSASVVTNTNNISALSASVVSNKNNVSALSASVVDNKNGLNALSASVVSNKNGLNALSASVVTNKNNVTALSASVVTNKNNIAALSAASVTMSGNINTNRADIDILSAAMIDNELVIAAAFNDLNRRVIEVSGNTGGGGGGQANVQSDWEEADTTSDAYIKNKPSIPKIQKLTTAEYNALATKDPDTLYILVD